MAIGRVSGSMLFSNLERQGVNLAIDSNVAYFDVNNRYVGINTSAPSYPLDAPGNAKISNIIIDGSTLSSNTGIISFGSASNISLTGGTPYDVLYTDGNGNLAFGNLNVLANIDGFTGNNIQLGVNTLGSLSNAKTFTTSTSVTDAVALLNQLLGNITDSTGTTVHVETVSGTLLTNSQPNINSVGTLASLVVTGDTSSGNVIATTFYGNVIGTSVNANVTGSVTGEILTSNQPNITTVGSLTDLVVDGNITTGGNITAGGNITVSSGNVTVVNSAFFVGNTITGVNALYAGIPVGYAVVPNEVAQFSGNINGYTQINFQNTNDGEFATTDWIATANNGSDSTYYIDLGIAGNGYVNTSPSNSLGTSLYANDAYLYVQGNTGALGANLVLGTTTVGTKVNILVGGIDAGNIVASFSNTSAIINLTQQSTNTATGALVVHGGTGILGNVNVGGNIDAAGQISTQGNIYSGNVYATQYNGDAAILGNITTTNGVFWANGASALSPLYGNANVAIYLPTYTGNLNPDNVVASSLFYGNIHTDVITPYQTDIVTINATSALGLPVGDNSARPIDASPGQIRFNSDANTLEFYTGSVWQALTNVIFDQSFYGNSIGNTFTLTNSTTASGILVSINGTVQQPGVAYTVNGDQITFTEVPLLSDLVDIRYLSASTVNNFNRIIVNSTKIHVSTVDTIINSFDSTLYRSAKYVVSSETSADSHMAEINLTQFNGTATVSVFGNVNTGSNTISYSANVSGSTVNLLGLATTSSNVRLQTTYFNI